MHHIRFESGLEVEIETTRGPRSVLRSSTLVAAVVRYWRVFDVTTSYVYIIYVYTNNIFILYIIL